jgi:hypothetical protein
MAEVVIVDCGHYWYLQQGSGDGDNEVISNVSHGWCGYHISQP